MIILCWRTCLSLFLFFSCWTRLKQSTWFWFQVFLVSLVFVRWWFHVLAPHRDRNWLLSVHQKNSTMSQGRLQRDIFFFSTSHSCGKKKIMFELIQLFTLWLTGEWDDQRQIPEFFLQKHPLARKARCEFRILTGGGRRIHLLCGPYQAVTTTHPFAWIKNLR